MSFPPSLLLASGSPRRRELLTQIGVSFVHRAPSVEECRRPGEAPVDYVQRLAADKARAGRAFPEAKNLPVLGADTIVVINDEVLEKPRDRAHAFAMWSQLSGQRHQVMSALALVTDAGVRQALSVTQVNFRTLTESQMADYWASGEAADKAGGYAIQGLGAAWVTGIEGSYSGVVGLPVERLVPLLEALDIPYWQISQDKVLP